MLNEQTIMDQNGFPEIDGLLNLDELAELDMGIYTVKLLQGSDRLYKVKTDRSSHMLNAMAEFRKNEQFCDVVLCVREKRFPAHKVVLASASANFASMFAQLNHQNTQTQEVIDLTSSVPCPLIMSTILEFIYTSQVQLSEKYAMPLLICCVTLSLDELAEICVAYLRDQLHGSNCVGMYLCGKKYQCKPLIEVAQDYIYEHFEDVVRHEEFLSLSYQDLCRFIKEDAVKVECESIVYTAVMQWVRHDPQKRRPLLEKILPCIRLALLGPGFVEGVLQCDDFASKDMEICRGYLTDIHDNLKSHRYFSLPPRRAPIKPLVIYCAGGYHNRSIKTMECYFLSTQKWKRCLDLPIPRSGVGVASLHMRVYVIGGRYNTKTESKDCHQADRYDPVMNQWMSLPPMLYARNRLGVGAIDCSIYAVGGSSGQQIHSSVERYSTAPDAQAWVEVSSMKIPRIGLAVCVNSRLLYAIGGFDGHRRLSEVESYDPDKDIWNMEEPLRIGRSGAAAAPLAEYIYVVGGYASDSSDGAMQLNSVEQYNIITQQWTLVKPMNHPRSALSCVTLDNHLFALGGYDGKNFTSVVEIYNPEKNEWIYGTPLTRERSGHGSALTIEPTLENDE